MLAYERKAPRGYESVQIDRNQHWDGNAYIVWYTADGERYEAQVPDPVLKAVCGRQSSQKRRR